MKNIKRLIADLQKSGYISPCVAGIITDFFSSDLKIDKDITDRDASDIFKAVSSHDFANNAKMNDDWLVGQFKEKLPFILADASMTIGTRTSDINKVMVVYSSICEKLQFARAS